MISGSSLCVTVFQRNKILRFFYCCCWLLDKSKVQAQSELFCPSQVIAVVCFILNLIHHLNDHFPFYFSLLCQSFSSKSVFLEDGQPEAPVILYIRFHQHCCIFPLWYTTASKLAHLIAQWWWLGQSASARVCFSLVTWAAAFKKSMINLEVIMSAPRMAL